MTPHDVPFDACWYGPSIPLYRTGNGTYERYPLDSIPPIPRDLIDGSYSWLDKGPAENRVTQSDRFADEFLRLQQQAVEHRLELPAEFTSFVGDVHRRRALPSVTGCYFRLPDRIVPSPGENGRFLIMFHSDSQDCLLWYLYLDRATGSHCVVVSSEYFGVDIEGEEEPESLDHLEFCAGSFSEYVFRVWVENSSWLQLSLALPLNEIQQAYLDHYRPPGDLSVRKLMCDQHKCFLEHGHKLQTAQVWNLIPTGAFRTPLWQPEESGFRFANLYSACSWMAERIPDYRFVETAYCPSCRRALIEYLTEHECVDFLRLLRTHSELEEIDCN